MTEPALSLRDVNNLVYHCERIDRALEAVGSDDATAVHGIWEEAQAVSASLGQDVRSVSQLGDAAELREARGRLAQLVPQVLGHIDDKVALFRGEALDAQRRELLEARQAVVDLQARVPAETSAQRRNRIAIRSAVQADDSSDPLVKPSPKTVLSCLRDAFIGLPVLQTVRSLLFAPVYGALMVGKSTIASLNSNPLKFLAAALPAVIGAIGVTIVQIVVTPIKLVLFDMPRAIVGIFKPSAWMKVENQRVKSRLLDTMDWQHTMWTKYRNWAFKSWISYIKG